MTIYGEYLFLENMVTGSLILILTGRFCGIKAKKRYILFGGALCGIYSFILFLQLSVSVVLLSKLVFSFLTVYLVFHIKDWRRLGKTVLVFYIVSFLLGGVTIAAMYAIGMKGVSNNTSFYIEHITYLNVAAGTLAAYLLISIFADFLKGRVLREQTGAEVSIRIGDRNATLNGVVDTANFLKDPLTGKPVFVMSEAGARQLVSAEELALLMSEEPADQVYEAISKTALGARVRLIPYKSVGEEKGMLIGLRPDRIQLSIGGKCSVLTGIVLAIYKGKFSAGEHGEECGILLNPAALEGGLVFDESNI